MNKWAELLLGVIILNLAVLILIFSPQWGDALNFRASALEFLKGGIVWLVIMIGALFVMLGISDLRG